MTKNRRLHTVLNELCHFCEVPANTQSFAANVGMERKCEIDAGRCGVHEGARRDPAETRAGDAGADGEGADADEDPVLQGIRRVLLVDRSARVPEGRFLPGGAGAVSLPLRPRQHHRGAGQQVFLEPIRLVPLDLHVLRGGGDAQRAAGLGEGVEGALVPRLFEQTPHHYKVFLFLFISGVFSLFFTLARRTLPYVASFFFLQQQQQQTITKTTTSSAPPPISPYISSLLSLGVGTGVVGVSVGTGVVGAGVVGVAVGIGVVGTGVVGVGVVGVGVVGVGVVGVGVVGTAVEGASVVGATVVGSEEGATVVGSAVGATVEGTGVGVDVVVFEASSQAGSAEQPVASW